MSVGPTGPSLEFTLLTFGLPRATFMKKSSNEQRRRAARPRFPSASSCASARRPILKRARTRKSSHEQRRGAEVVFGRERSQALKLLTFGLPRATLKRSRSRTREGSHKQRRGAAVVFGPEGSDAFDFWSAACNLEASSNEGEFARATPSGRPPALQPALPHAFDF